MEKSERDTEASSTSVSGGGWGRKGCRLSLGGGGDMAGTGLAVAPPESTPAHLQVYPPSSGDDYGRDAAYPSDKTPGSSYPSPFYMADGSLHPSAELWSTPGQAGFGPMLGGASSPLSLAPSSSSSVGGSAFGGLQQPERMVGWVGAAGGFSLLLRDPHFLTNPCLHRATSCTGLRGTVHSPL